MDVMNIKEAYNSLRSSEEVFMRFDDGDYTYIIKPEDDVEFSWSNSIFIKNKKVWIDADKISYLHVRGKVELWVSFKDSMNTKTVEVKGFSKNPSGNSYEDGYGIIPHTSWF